MEQLSPGRMKHDKLQVKLSLRITPILFNKSSPHSPQVMNRRDFHHENYHHHRQFSDQGIGA